MEPLLYLVHRIPYPPNKGDKIRSYHLLRFLAQRYRVFLGTFVDDEADLQHLVTVQSLCAAVNAVPLNPTAARLRSLTGVLNGEALTLPYYRDRALRRWVRETVAANAIRKIVVFSSAMAQYVDGIEGAHVVADFCDVDSDKWQQYARRRAWPASMIYGREARRLLDFERGVVAQMAACVFVTPAEVDLFASLAPECAARLHAIGNGVDTEYFAPNAGVDSPYSVAEEPIVFTGAMDYWPNIDAVSWFAREVMPLVRQRQPRARFYVVGMNPAPTVTALAADEAIVVTGTVADVRPYLQHARVAVAPMRVARGVQNKAFEAMAMARPLVASSAVAQGIVAAPGVEFEIAADAREFAQKVLALMDDAMGNAMGQQARRRIVADYNWDARLGMFADLLNSPPTAPRATRGA